MTEPRIGKWLTILIEQANDPDYNDGDEVLGWLSADLVGDVITVEYESGEDNTKTFEKYRVIRLEDK
jgi:hypothetical protein